MADGKPKLLDQLHQQIRVRNYSIRTEAVHVEWAKSHLRLHYYQHQAELGAVAGEALLTHLAVARDASASAQNQALAWAALGAKAIGVFHDSEQSSS